jgi:tetratricopeptide (TPR) repeat protein
MRYALLAAILLLSGCGGATMPKVRPHAMPESAAVSPFDNAYQAGKSHLMADRIGLAIVMFEKALLFDPLSVPALNATGTAYDELHRSDVAKKYYIKALSIEPNSADTLNNMAISAAMSGNVQESHELFLRAAKLDPTNPMILANMQMAGLTAATIQQSSRLAFANNNPGNLKFVGQAGAILGEGGFAKFETAKDGIVALHKQVHIDAERGLSVRDMIYKYAPPSENKTELYITQLIQALNVTRDTKVANIPKDALVNFIAKKESSTDIGWNAMPEVLTAINEYQPQIERTGFSEYTLMLEIKNRR